MSYLSLLRLFCLMASFFLRPCWIVVALMHCFIVRFLYRINICLSQLQTVQWVCLPITYAKYSPCRLQYPFTWFKLTRS